MRSWLSVFYTDAKSKKGRRHTDCSIIIQLSNKMDNSLLAVRFINHKYIVVGRRKLPMERTISGMVGKGSVNHNTRAFTAKNVDSDRSGANIHFCNEDIKQVYHKLFDEALERYNAKQKRKDRVIDDY